MYWMQTFTGRKIFPLQMKEEDIDIKDIAHGLSLICRYGGQCLRFYSVAEHCCILYDYIEPKYKFLALMHDASEAYIGDMIRPIKWQLKEYKLIQDRISKLIYMKYNIDDSEYSIIKGIDNQIQRDECQQNLAIDNSEQWLEVGDRPLGITLKFWTPAEAEREFMDRFNHEMAP